MNKYDEFLGIVVDVCIKYKEFAEGAVEIENWINKLERKDFIEIVSEVGTIPEQIKASSTEEKMYSKASDIVLARCFRELGLSSKAVTARGNSADVVAESDYRYTLVADAKCFRMSRTAKNQKDFKVDSLSKWREDNNDYAVLVAPYFQYPNKVSQIYGKALTGQVCLLSWEHILFLLENGAKENVEFNLEKIWEAPKKIARSNSIADRDNCHLNAVNKAVCERLGVSDDCFRERLKECSKNIVKRSENEKAYIRKNIAEINRMSREQAIKELIKSLKLNERIRTIEKYIEMLGVYNV